MAELRKATQGFMCSAPKLNISHLLSPKKNCAPLSHSDTRYVTRRESTQPFIHKISDFLNKGKKIIRQPHYKDR